MGAPNSAGIYVFDGTEPANNLKDLLNLLGSTTSVQVSILKKWQAAVRFQGSVIVQTAAPHANGGVMGSISIPAREVATVIEVSFIGQGGFDSSARKVGVDFTTTAGTLTGPAARLVYCPASEWATVVHTASLALPADTAAVLSAVGNSDSACYYAGTMRAGRMGT